MTRLLVLLLGCGVLFAEEQPIQGWNIIKGKWTKTKRGVSFSGLFGALQLAEDVEKQVDLRFDIVIHAWRKPGYSAAGIAWGVDPEDKKAARQHACFYVKGLWFYENPCALTGGPHTYDHIKMDIPFGKPIRIKARITKTGIVLMMNKVKKSVSIKVDDINRVWLNVMNADVEFLNVKVKVK